MYIGSWLDMMGDCCVGCMVFGDRLVGIVVVSSLIVGIIGSWLDKMFDFCVGCMVCGYCWVFLFRRSKNTHTKTGG